MSKNYSGRHAYSNGEPRTAAMRGPSASLPFEEMAKAFFYAKAAKTEEELQGKLEEYYRNQSREPVKAFYLESAGSGNPDVIDENEEYVAAVAVMKGKDPKKDVKWGYAWKDEKGSLTSLTMEELTEYNKAHPRFFKK